MNFKEIAMEGYCVLNPESKVARLTEANTALSEDDVIAYARMAENLYHFPIFYLEYSGTYGSPGLVQQVAGVLERTKLFYGGGIRTVEQANQMLAYADTIVIGNLIYENLHEALRTVEAVKGTLQ